MVLRSPARTIADLRMILAKLEKDRNAYNRMSFAQLRRILRRRIATLTAELRGAASPGAHRRAA
jgi:hypothetical protein